jgi:hypothetical protein
MREQVLQGCSSLSPGRVRLPALLSAKALLPVIERLVAKQPACA